MVRAKEALNFILSLLLNAIIFHKIIELSVGSVD